MRAEPCALLLTAPRSALLWHSQSVLPHGGAVAGCFLRHHTDIQFSYPVLILLGNSKAIVGSDWASPFCYISGNCSLCFNNYFSNKNKIILLWFSDDLPANLFWPANPKIRISLGIIHQMGQLKQPHWLSKYFRNLKHCHKNNFNS